jgi:hypothetical protein
MDEVQHRLIQQVQRETDPAHPEYELHHPPLHTG